DFSNLLTTGIERIEVVRGPQSALWGSDAMAGVVHIITKPQADDSSSSGRLTVEGGSFGTGRAEASWRYRTDKASGKVSLGWLDTDGTNIARTGSEDDGYENSTLSVVGAVNINQALEVSYNLRLADTRTEFDKTEMGLQADADHHTAAEYIYGGARLSHQINDRLSHSLQVAKTDTDNNTDEGTAVKGITRGEKTAARYQFNVLGERHRLSLLAEHEDERFAQRGLVQPFGDPNHNRSLTTNSLAAEYRLDGDGLDLSISARQDANSDFKDALSWRATASWRLADDTRLIASAGRSVKNPTFSERFGSFTNFVGNPDLRPEKSLGYELGIRQALFGDRLNTSLTWFAADLTDEINGFFCPGDFDDPCTADNKNDKSERTGAELEVSWLASDQLEVRGHYTYLDATEEGAGGKEVDELRRPVHSGALSGVYRFDKGEVELSASITGEQEDIFFPERVTLDGFALVSLSGYYALNQRLAITLRLENLLDEDYEQVYSYASPGFGGYLGLRASW
ncbi:MAG: TonB-dependent receptor plug domain-containing protein, partial [Pseudomonadales bacterium]